MPIGHRRAVLSTVNIGALHHINLDEGVATLRLGSGPLTNSVTATGYDLAGRALSPQPTFTYASSNTGVATVSSSGVITAVGPGTCTITVSNGAVSSSALAITVVGLISAITLSVASMLLNQATTSGAFTATAVDVNGRVLVPQPTFGYASSDTSIATVAAGVVTKVADGNCTVTASNGAVTSSALVVNVALITTKIALTLTPNPTTGAFTAVGVAKNRSSLGSHPTGQAVFLDSSDVSKATIDNVTGVGAKAATGTAVITAKLVAASTSDEPFFTGAAGETMILDDGFDGYTDVVSMGNVADKSVPRWAPEESPDSTGIAVDTTHYSLVTGRGGTGKALRMTNYGSSGVATTLPENMPAAMGDPLATFIFQRYSRWSANCVTLQPKYKGTPLWYYGEAGHLNANTFYGGDLVAGAMTWGIHAMSYDPDLTAMQQTVHPIPTDVYDFAWHRITMRTRSHTPNAGTLTYIPWVMNVTFFNDQSAVLANGNRIRVPSFDNSVEWVVSSLAGYTATLTRQSDTTGVVVAWTGGIWNGGNPSPTQITEIHGFFSVSQTGVVSNGDLIALNNTPTDGGFGSSYTVSNLSVDGLTCHLTKYASDRDTDPYMTDTISHNWSSNVNHTGCFEMWVDGNKIIDFRAAMIGQYLPGAARVACTRGVLSTLGVNVGIRKIWVGGTQTNSDGTTWTEDLDDAKWWKVAA